MIRLTILHTNDIHGKVSQLIRIATVVRQIRNEVEAAGGYCLYVDAGDSEDTTLLESNLTKGSAMNAILHGAGCEYVALGNAIPVRYGPKPIADLAKHFGRPLLCANFYNENDQLAEGLEPYAIHRFGDFKLGIIGATDPRDVYEIFFKLHPPKPDDILPSLIEQVRAQGVHTILLLSHLGLRDDRRVVENIPGIDILIGGHSHEILDPPLVINGTIVAQAGEYGKLLGRLDLEIDPGSGKVTHFESTLIPIDENIPPDPRAQLVYESEQVRAQELMSRVVGTLTDPIDLADDRECAAGNLLADALLERVKGAEIAFVLAGQWTNGLGAGELTQGNLFAANRSTSNPGRVQLTGGQILQFFQEALKPGNATRQIHPLRGRKLGMPHVAGATVRYTENLEISEIMINGKRLDKDKKYIAASTDLEFDNRINYLTIPYEQIEFEVPTVMPEVLEDYIAKHSPLQKPAGGRVALKVE